MSRIEVENMLLKPKALENIIVGLLVDDKFTWYVTHKDIWFLDQKKQTDAYRKKFTELGLKWIESNIEAADERKDIEVLNEHTFTLFINRINKYSVSTVELRELLKEELEVTSVEDAFYSFLPSLYINIAERELYSMYSEPSSYEDYVPKYWKGEYEDFIALIDRKDKYWFDENGTDLLHFERMIRREE